MSLKFYKHDPAAFLGGVEGMTLEEIGAYTLLLNHMYARGGALSDRETFIASLLDCDVRVWRRLRTSLIRKGKLLDRGDGFLSNRRVEAELEAFVSLRAKRVKSGAVGGQKSAAKRAAPLQVIHRLSPDVEPKSYIATASLTPNSEGSVLNLQEIAEAGAQALAQAKSNQSKKKREVSSLRSDTSLVSSLRSDTGEFENREIGREGGAVVALRPPAPLAAAIEAYNRTAEANGWRRCREISAKRKQAVAARLRKHGLDGWVATLALAAKSEWINNPDARAREHKTWKANLDWFAREDTFIRLIESADESALREVETHECWAKRLAYFRDKGVWFERKWGPPPGSPGCRAPNEALQCDANHVSAGSS